MTGYIFVTLIAAAMMFAFYILLPSIAKLILRRRFLRSIMGTQHAFLTFDDGPDPNVTPQLLEILNAAGVKATFFVLGEKAKAHPQLVQSMLDMGHEVGEHSNCHHYPWASGPIQSTVDLWGCSHALDTLKIDPKRRLFRPPYGKLNLVGLVYILTMRRRVVFWNLDPQDYRRDTGEEIVSIVARDLAPGAVILLHDGTTNAEPDSGSPVVVEALKGILEHAAKSGIAFATVGSVLDKEFQPAGASKGLT